MRIAATGAMLLLLSACSTTEQATESPFQNPNSLMAGEITRRVEQIPYQHRDELLQNMLWLAQTGEQTIPALLEGLRAQDPKTRSSCAWVLGRIRDRRTIPNLQNLMRDEDPSVQMEAARSLVTMGDLTWSPSLIEGLDSERKEVRYLCHEALKTASGHDFGYDHLNQNEHELRMATLRWRQWWSETSGDKMFAQSYEKKYGLNQMAAPAGETQPQPSNVPPAAMPMGEPNDAPKNEGRKPIEIPPSAEPLPMPEPTPQPK